MNRRTFLPASFLGAMAMAGLPKIAAEAEMTETERANIKVISDMVATWDMVAASNPPEADKLKTFLNDGLADVSFFGFYNGSPKVINVVFVLSLDKNGKPIVAYKLHPVLDFTVIGISRDIINASPEDLPSKDLMEHRPELYVEGLVKIEAKKQPLVVSEPIDLLELKPDGAVWIRKNENAIAYE